MEQWQIDWIAKHSVKLQRNTRCTVRLLSALQAKGVLEYDDIAELDDESSTASKVKKFYNILMTKNRYDILTEELENCKQDGAVTILREGKSEHEKQSKEECKKVGNADDGSQREKRVTQGWTVQDILDLGKSTEDCDLTLRSLTLLASSLKVSAVIERNQLSFNTGLKSIDTVFEDILKTWRNKPGATLESLIQALAKAELDTLASALEKKYKLGKYANQDEPEPENEDDDKDGCFPSKPKRKPEPTSDCDDDDTDKGDDVVDFRRIRVPLEVKITPPKNDVKATKDFYKLPVANKGLALIINIMSFDNKGHGKRVGSQHDIAYMENLWSQLGYTIFPGAPFLRQERKTDRDVTNLITQFKEECKRTKAKSIVVFIGSHGYYDKIVTSNEEKLDLHKDIISPFNTDNCPWLADKPKMFFVQACQQYEQTDRSMPKLPMDHSSLMIAQFPGFPANRNAKVGSWFAYCLTCIVMKYAHRFDLKKLMKKAQTMLAEAEGASDFPQQARITDDGIANLYFNMDHS